MKQPEEPRPLSFNEQRALHDLQELQRQIERLRGQRKDAEAEFDKFVRGFRPGEQRPDSTRPVAAPGPPHDAAREPRPFDSAVVATRSEQALDSAVVATRSEQALDSAEVATRSGQAFDSAEVATRSGQALDSAEVATRSGPAFESRAPDARLEQPEERPSFFKPAAQVSTSPVASMLDAAETAAPPQRRRDLRMPVVIAVAAVAVIAAIAMLGTRSTPQPSQVSSAPATTPEPPAAEPSPATPPATSAAVPPTAAQKPPQGGVNLEIVTLKPVWVRVTIDGRRAIERELPPGQRIPVHGERTILIRAGNAGGIAVRRNGGAEAILGPEGVALTREFSADRPGGATPVR